jgi:hypothetical protein
LNGWVYTIVSIENTGNGRYADIGDGCYFTQPDLAVLWACLLHC